MILTKQHQSPALQPRLTAALIDYFVLFLFWFAFSIIFGKQTGGLHYVVEGNIAYVPVYGWILYFVLFEWINQGTMGKRFMGIKLASRDGRRVTVSQVIIRRICDPLEIWFSFGIVGIARIRMNPSGQRFGDQLAGTLVVGKTL